MEMPRGAECVMLRTDRRVARLSTQSSASLQPDAAIGPEVPRPPRAARFPTVIYCFRRQIATLVHGVDRSQRPSDQYEQQGPKLEPRSTSS